MSDGVLYLTAWAETWKATLRDALADDERGQGMVEYGLILALVAIAAIVALGFLSGTIQRTFIDTGKALNQPTPTTVGGAVPTVRP
jgi:pilus assembly protein Flp/PilA